MISVLRPCLLGLLAGTCLAADGVALRLIGVKSIPVGTAIEGTAFGGLSGIDYDPDADRWIAISDDRSERSAARAYTVALRYDEAAFTGVEITGVITVLAPDGRPYPGSSDATAGREVPDLEALRIDPRDGRLWVASEGDGTRRTPPFVRCVSREGRPIGELPLPEQLRFSPAENRGPRANLTLESLSFSADGNELWLGLEAPLAEDESTSDGVATVRITRLNRAGEVHFQFAYPLDPPPAGLGKRPATGLSELLALPDGRLLALERTGAEIEKGRYAFLARLYVTDPAGARDLRSVPSLRGTSAIAATKRLVYDFSASGRPWIDNLEGLSWGRRLANGHRTLVVVSDDNFLPGQETQFWIFEVLSPL